MKYNTYTLKKAEALLKDASYVLRYEKGNFNSGYCILEDKKVVVINKYFSTESKVSSLLEIIQKLQIDKSTLSDESNAFLDKLSQLTFENLE